ncbi:glycosyltransferase family 1 protein [Enterococcus avium]|uniref:glycosyltransferase family 1 protein n=1 Tax=Enterococcus avium TaxID=33945 RepID=UPI00288FB0C5|nr:glycosyltransferase family 1 protein [Enterococcus avium]MDT2395341.1 glycosyltransferase family 1 protein [Enterococcus avium]MDT2419794.1 glycosyltransferase family 1 protein [Enterococcus avium]MDT2432721.1 glycosyltransferase family 1 protein [Enterococcus avium]MDT2441628.1 glycosyltransferase family 1 protein [Enterococcus avium]MDT2454550.1 glycosyltransferase family 1 protein [Enterococcus avium]
MSTQPWALSQLQLFVTKRERLEKAIMKAYTDSRDADTVIQYVVAVLVRNALCISDFSLICQDLVREILLFAEPTDVLRKFAPLFREFFGSGKEWEQVTRRLYKKTKEYHRYNNRVSDCKKYLFAKTTPIEELNGQQYKLVSTFEDAIGKIHTWSLRDADKNASAMKIDAVLELLSSLSIFEKDGVRRFVKLENSEIDNCTRHLKIRKGEIVEESAQTSASQTEAAKPSFDFSTMSEEERLQLVEMLLPEGIVLADTRSEGHKENPDNEEISLPEKSIATSQEPESTSGAVTSIVKETPEPVEENKKTKNPQSIYKKPKSKKQIAIEEKTDLMKRKNKGQSNPKKSKDRKRRRRK